MCIRDRLLVATGLGALSIDDPSQYILMAIFLAFLVGAIQLLMGLFRMGFIISFLSKPVIIGFTSAAAVIIGLSQLKHILGIELSQSNQLHIFIQSLINSNSSLKVDSLEKLTNKVTIADADIVVSGGRGLKGPENWHLIENLAEALGAATACSKPVSDMGWRPHSEHVGQTGKPVASNLYIAVGISGAIQHLAGINSSKVKVVINNDPEAPFFRSADYGIVGDAFEVLPKLIEGLKAIK